MIGEFGPVNNQSQLSLTELQMGERKWLWEVPGSYLNEEPVNSTERDPAVTAGHGTSGEPRVVPPLLSTPLPSWLSHGHGQCPQHASLAKLTSLDRPSLRIGMGLPRYEWLFSCRQALAPLHSRSRHSREPQGHGAEDRHTHTCVCTHTYHGYVSSRRNSLKRLRSL